MVDAESSMMVGAERLSASDPFGLELLGHLASGPAMLSKLAMLTRASRERLLRHLAALQAAGLVDLRHEGSQAVYMLAACRLAVPAVPPLRGAEGAHGEGAWPPLILARTCHDHVAGRIGVALFEELVARGAVLDPGPPKPNGTGAKTPVALGPKAGTAIGAIGVDLDAVRRRKARLAFACRDWTERRAHLGGALGAALFDALRERDWLRPRSGSRALEITIAGRVGLARWLGAEPWA
jgi:DNA-binding transcriptional ArsR family regulator